MNQNFESLSNRDYIEGGLSLNYADKMVENCIGKLSLPLGLGLNFTINSKDYKVPMVIEEPSVIAAASGAAKFIRERGTGFSTFSTEPIMIGQIQIIDVDPIIASREVMKNQSVIIRNLILAKLL